GGRTAAKTIKPHQSAGETQRCIHTRCISIKPLRRMFDKPELQSMSQLDVYFEELQPHILPLHRPLSLG
ncbi:hypothetical protein ABVT39_026108, partial [Epinephelus coioides]